MDSGGWYCIIDFLMFTGIVETTAPILRKTNDLLVLGLPSSFDDIAIGCSIAVSGVCLSVIAFDDASMSFNVVGETWARTNLGQKKEGDAVNLERALAANGRFEGHIMQGHIEGTAHAVEWRKDGQWTVLALRLSPDLLPYIVFKGSIAIDGVSLTVAGLEGDICTIALIPHTLEVTTLGSLKPGDAVNIETDILARYVESLLSKKSQ